MLTATQKEQLVNQVKHFVELGNHKLNTNLDIPSVKFKKRGTVGGTALYRKYGTSELDFNAGLAVENFDEYMNQVVPHEVAHLLKSHVYGGRGRGAMSSHGHYWQMIMRTLDVSPDRCHDMDVSNQTTRRPQSKYIYICHGCNEELVMGPKHHAKVQAGNGTGLHHKGCRGAALTYSHPAGAVSWKEAQENKNNAPKAAPKAAPKRKAPAKRKAAKKGTKIDQAIKILLAFAKQNEEATPKEVIAHIQAKMNVTTERATSYYKGALKGMLA